jgi:hypothetical protein
MLNKDKAQMLVLLIKHGDQTVSYHGIVLLMTSVVKSFITTKR